MTVAERGLWLEAGSRAARQDLATFAERVLRLDEAGIVRLRRRDDESVVAWAATGFDVLASRVVTGRIAPADLCAGADALVNALRDVTADGYVDPGFSMDSAWRGVLPPAAGFVHLDDVPARVVLDLAQRGSSLAKEHSGAHGPPPSLLDQEVVAVSSAQGSVGVPMRCVFALTAMGFLPQSPAGDRFAPESVRPDEVVRVRTTATWLRVDARFGSVYRRRGDPAVVLR
ncbi:hypothetical protein [Mycolicibacterium vaccae]|uniref:Uncharacterized protein n=1 Tax=Mycolicibacterium vaccae ATCC 25954 TaxID=1194972 RepID=K0UFL8_MYCVA|nr:hypothetical protein [Mycolicibacterium vaccae]ANI40977.1 hypothetical protein MYVA_3864 [Mycolicibacterium vaccae 95051]EJZ05661.1 hypothetical protein MVAC_24401 [Mycolicibacterium vaccae ATCC 25954]MCV7062270.1 hypothetical protein [Mycolicibacterium vaccae]